MKNLIFTLMLVLLVNSPVTLAENMTTEQATIKSLIEKMYAIDPDTFEYRNFGAKYKKGKEIHSGKYDPDRHCHLLTEFLAKEAIVEDKVNSGCLINNFRYPGVDDEELSPRGRYEPLPKHNINTPVVNRDQAKVYVEIEKNRGDAMYFLKKLPEGWRIYRVESRQDKDSSIIGDVVDIFPPGAQSK